ncbi:conjugal transfer protein TraG N-terminal domain-containing protein [Acidovorax sp. NCPPB 3576]|uniref:conjugal transfer protein TraG N-terminal domain-containing protein n=1 Tax=Acidovorax sp. NCPPB 3576 TaxID=2940488 RepID=UPI00234BF024|nr:conjugal transfer protein TraG N-terminal domain-containing protein [Acidovorax sp. NCPPB 3576]WCM90541.1 conjugal transfer protein TraG N-terminal domain-containing protein [Acidovorax sp. NCPPB 3576]
MQLDSYLEIFTTMYGWAFANIIGEVITGTGLVIVPFAVILFNAWRDAKEQGLESAGVLPLLESVGTKIIVALFVMSLCFATTPITSLSSVNLSYLPDATPQEPNPTMVSRNGGTGSGYDAAMKDASDGTMSTAGNLSQVPAWWFSTMAISSGINRAVRAGIRSGDRQIRMVEDMARNATIQDPRVLNAIQRFYSECFIPARSRYLAAASGALSPTGQSIVAVDNKEYGPTDVDWIGSQLFRTEPGYYADMRSYNPVPDFPVDFSRDIDYYNPASGIAPPHSGVVNPEWGRPTCKQWWEDGSHGVREKMVGHAGSFGKLVEVAGTAMNWSSMDQAKDAFARLAQKRANPQFVDPDRIMGTDYDTVTSFSRTVVGAATVLGVGWEATLASLSMQPLITGLPMIQALVLMAIYMFLPLITFLSGYDLRVLFYGAVAIFTVKLWATMWFIAQWIDARLIDAMYPGAQGNIFVQEISQLAGSMASSGYKRMILNILMICLFVGLPMVWTIMMGWVGINIGTQLNEMMKSSEGLAKSSAGSTAGPVKAVGKTITKL